MQLLKKTAELFLLAAFIFLLFIVAFEQRIQMPNWLQVAGRMHPMLLHFPIVLLLIYFFSLWLPRQVNENWITGLGLVATLTAVITAMTGFILSLEEIREGTTFSLHKWGGIIIALLSAIIYYLHSLFGSRKIILGPLTLAGCVLIFFTGHWGANLTHGENYLLQPMAAAPKKADFDKAFAFEDVVAPVLQNKCGSCHNASNAKGGLSIADTTGLLEGGKTGPFFIAGNVDSSLFMQRILLPQEHKKHMAPKAKPQLTDDEILLLKAWIKSGAPLHKKIMDLPATDSFRIIAANYLSPSSNNLQIAYNFPAAEESKITSLNNNYRFVTSLGKGSPALSVQFYGKDGYSAKALEELLGVKQQITELNIARLPVKDEDIKFVQQFINLEKLNLNYTDVTDKGISQLNNLKNLKELALSGTAVTVAALKNLLQLPQLSSVYIWNTGLDSLKIAGIQQLNKNVRFETGFDSKKDTTTYKLTPPLVKTKDGIFEDNIVIEMKHGIKGVELRYTLDGSEPDSLRSPLYKTGIPMDSSVVLKAKAFREGWHSSNVVEQVFMKKGLTIDSIELLTPPDKSLNPKNEKILHDDIIGKVTPYRNNKWFGYQKNAAVFLLHFAAPVSVKELWVLCNKLPQEHIFPAQTIEVWGGVDKKKMKLLRTVSPVMPTANNPTAVVPIELVFTPTTVKYVKVIVQPLKQLPKWHDSKGKPGWVLVSELVVN